jgi:adenylate cyclase
MILSVIYLSSTGGIEQPGLFAILILVISLTSLEIFLSVSSQYEIQLNHMKETVAEILKGNLSGRIDVVSEDELGYLAEGFNEMSLGLAEKDKIYETFGRVVDPEVRDYLLRSHIDPGGEIRDVTVLFTDIRGFTGLSERLSADKIVALLNRYFDTINSILRNNGGMINKYIGDAVMGVFNAPLENTDHKRAALRSGHDIILAIQALNQELINLDLPAIDIGIGIHSGFVVAGTVGSRERQEYTVIGDTVNVASRLEGLNKDLQSQILFTKEIADTALFPVRSLGIYPIRGKEQTFELFTLA